MRTISLAHIIDRLEVPDCDCPPLFIGEYRDLHGHVHRIPLGHDRRTARQRLDFTVARLEEDARADFYRQPHIAALPEPAKKRAFLKWLREERGRAFRYSKDLSYVFPPCRHTQAAPATMTIERLQHTMAGADYLHSNPDLQILPDLPAPPLPIRDPVREERVAALAWRHENGFHLWHRDDSTLDDAARYQRLALAGAERHPNGADRKPDLTIETGFGAEALDESEENA